MSTQTFHHVCSFAFGLTSHKEDASDLSALDFRSALTQQLFSMSEEDFLTNVRNGLESALVIHKDAEVGITRQEFVDQWGGSTVYVPLQLIKSVPYHQTWSLIKTKKGKILKAGVWENAINFTKSETPWEFGTEFVVIE